MDLQSLLCSGPVAETVSKNKNLDLDEATPSRKRRLSDETPISSKKPLLSDDIGLSDSSSRATLNYQHLLNVPRCELRQSPGKGWGLFAQHDIKEGEEIINERPILVIELFSEERRAALRQPGDTRSWIEIETDNLEKGYESLPKEWQRDIRSLHISRKDLSPGISGIFWTNSFGISKSPRLSAIYLFCSNINHDCNPNCFHIASYVPDTLNHKDRTMVIIASRDIKAGDELTISYISPMIRFEKRQNILSENYGFKCSCRRCTSQRDQSYDWPRNKQKNVGLRFRRRKPRAVGENRKWNHLTIIQSISSDGSIVKKDEIIWQETPLIFLMREEVAACSSKLSRLFFRLPIAGQNDYLKLWIEPSTEEPWPEFLDDIPPDNTIFEIWATSRFRLGECEGVFSFASCLGHSCEPSCRVVWRPEEKTLDLVANSPLKVGDEITICYNQKISSLSPERGREFLKKNYVFDCFCSKCLDHLSDSSLVSTSELSQTKPPSGPAAAPSMPKETTLQNQQQLQPTSGGEGGTREDANSAFGGGESDKAIASSTIQG